MRRVAIIASASGTDALIPYALRGHFRRRREWPRELANRNVVRLCTTAEVAAWQRRSAG